MVVVGVAVVVGVVVGVAVAVGVGVAVAVGVSVAVAVCVYVGVWVDLIKEVTMKMLIATGLGFAFGWLWGAAWLLDKLDAARGALRMAQEDVKRLQQRALLKFPMPLHAGDQVRIEQANFCPVEK